jgi:hypothetical protein
MGQENIRERILKLLMLGQSKCNPFESEVALRKAYELQDRYNLYYSPKDGFETREQRRVKELVDLRSKVSALFKKPTG